MPKQPDKEAGKARAGRVERLDNTGSFTGGSSDIAIPGLSVIISGLTAAIRAQGDKPLPAGTPGKEISIGLADLRKLLVAAATQDAQQEVWVQGRSELLILTSKISITLDDGFALVSIPVSCDQAANEMIQIPFALGGKETPSGLVMATETRPRGAELIVDLWGEALIAYAWRLLVSALYRVSAQSGVDEDGTGLIPISLVASKDGLTMLPMARHTFDRVKL